MSASGKPPQNVMPTPEAMQHLQEQAKAAIVKLPLLGPMAFLMGHHPVKRFNFIGDLEWMLMPPLILDQAKVYTRNDAPVGFATWAFVNDEIDKRFSSGNLKIGPTEWKTGPHLWLIDLVVPFGSQEDIVKDLREKVFAGKKVKMLVPDPTGKAAKIAEWSSVQPSKK
ncbi:MAG: toxin-activating lysine-acyltransferase [Burkholderiales bacterium]